LQQSTNQQGCGACGACVPQPTVAQGQWQEGCQDGSASSARTTSAGLPQWLAGHHASSGVPTTSAPPPLPTCEEQSGPGRGWPQQWSSGKEQSQDGGDDDDDSAGGCQCAGHEMHRLEQISRKLSHVLRHGDRVRVRQDGFCQVDELLNLRRLQELECTLDDLRLVVAGSPESGNKKVRFQLVTDKEHGPLIRATQGFSRKDVLAEQCYRRLTPHDEYLPGPCVHGTYRWHWDSICRSGLLPGGLRGKQQRSEVHFACEEPGKDGYRAVSGMRSDCNLVIWLDLQRALEDGLPFYISENGVVLSPGDAHGCIPALYFHKALDYTVDPPLLLWHSGSPIQ